MTSKGPKSKLDHESRAKRQKALEPPKEPQRPKTHWDHLIEEMVWLSKDFESERKFKLALAKKTAIRASKGMVDQATREERKAKEEELRMKKVALNISKDVKKFWTKIEKLVQYKHRLELDQKKKKALDKQLDFLLGQTERYSTMLAENLVDSSSRQHVNASSVQELPAIEYKDQTDVNGCTEPHIESQSNIIDTDEDYKSENEVEDDERTIEEDEALITEDERREELAALQNEADLPLEELLKRYAVEEEKTEDVAELNQAHEDNSKCNGNDASDHRLKEESRHCVESNGGLLSVSPKHHLEIKEHYVRKRKRLQAPKKYLELDFNDENEDGDFVIANGDDKDDETTLLEEEELAKAESGDSVDEIALLQKESEIPIEDLLARYRQDPVANRSTESGSDSESEKENKQEQKIDDGDENEDRIADAAAAARSAQPTGNTFLTTKVRTKHPFLLKFSLREYQHIGLDWLVTMYEKRLNGILADEMGLGKTIMTIALLAHLACEKGIWGPHLIVVPTSVMLNWETEFLKWCPAFKILTYFGNAKERKHKRQGWMKPNTFHVCITTYRLVIQDSKIFKRKKWKYLILDEAHLIKNWKSQRWQTLLNFNAKRRILLTGTPLQNDLMELWSLMHFLMPHIFQSHQEFKAWFSNPISGMVEGQEKVNKEVVDRLHNVLRPFILRRLKRDVEKQLPSKHEHVIYCRLSRRQRNLYEDFIASSETQATLASSNFFGMISVIMQLRKVCNHPDLFEGRPIISSFDMNRIETQFCSSICSVLNPHPFLNVDLSGLGFVFTHLDFYMTSWESDAVQAIETPSRLIEKRVEEIGSETKFVKTSSGFNIFEEIQNALREERLKEMKERAESIAWWNSLRCKRKPVYSTGLRDIVSFQKPVLNSSKFSELVLSPVDRFERMVDQVESFMFAIPAARAPQPVGWCSKSDTSVFIDETYKLKCSKIFSPLLTPIRPAIVRRQVYFPDRRLIQFDCGKLQELAVLLRRLKSEGHRALIFTQMTKMLDVLEAFINIYGYTYMRLDGSTQPEERQTLMQRFNTNPKYFLFILSTRSGGVGINLVGADTVIFYDSDWNPAMDQQAQDRCHRIGQTREVHIYRLISESTIEENILKKAKQKRALDDLVIQSGEYNTEFFKKLDPMELFSGHKTVSVNNMRKDKGLTNGVEVNPPVSNADVDAALKLAEDEADYMALKRVEQEEAVDNQEFTEDAIGKPEDDELLNEEDGTAPVEENAQTPKWVDPNDEKGAGAGASLVKVDDDNDVEMMDDVKQMTVVSGNDVLSFEKQLRPIDRYAVRFLELWDPIVDYNLVESQERFEQTEWELDRIEKLKEDMEADGDDDEEPLVYERWDSEFATKAYQEQVKVLAERQLMEEREMEAREKEKALAEAESMKNETVVKKSKSKKKSKKTKFKSLKKEALSSETKTTNIESPIEDYDDDLDEELIFLKKRKKPADDTEVKSSKKSKKVKRLTDPIPLDTESNSVPDFQDEPLKDLKLIASSNHNNLEVDYKPFNRSKTGIRISITSMPVKRVMTIRLEKLKRGSIWPNDCFPTPDSWLSSEDAVLCAIVHEYGVNWSLASDVLYGMTAGGFYRGIARHPVHCCERYRELVQKYVLSTVDNNITNEKSSGKALLRVSEEHAKMLLDIVSEQSDQSHTLQQHFCYLLTTVEKSKTRHGQRKSPLRLKNGIVHIPGVNRDPVKPQSQEMNFANVGPMSRLVADALDNSQNIPKEDRVSSFNGRHDSRGVDQLTVTLELGPADDGQSLELPPVISLSINEPESVASELVPVPVGGNRHLRPSSVESRFRDISRVAVEGGLASPPSSFPTVESKSRPPKSQLSGKHRLSNPETPLKHSKSKSRKTITDSNDLHLRPPSTLPNELSSRFEAEASISSVGIDDFLTTETGLESFDTVPHIYDPGFTSGLEDCSLLTQFTDIG
ncbi:putative DNA helicase chromatin remodeling SNF2 family [Helianthus annuus]|uniref:DNA helicase n=1 Tax=Helianthus annuus TaxID=4232 RepID=A0A251TG92_HELAN|nr:protein PHOTOPERIOD-INDEPENDENT EARLY FLOWERING 1 [Helianthus annuus]KAJ0503173.1 putative DNA helicase chromatin remodeling SNF2 family [Helianthus annuus]KAJ0511427.1 putative DNA helicase chromatin remodeling SNF2 family [Helianthus annuus]KAJ0519140.1 putative DNA helicase chromatin remodeling SNF2 family [Helianthus annuus]KAJ0687133.1 putative DNA helicase chromatin remodeling SNF2 family [Helianthus annuus]KAJ0872599.1 putative DNA helicase chromatin remodeling SNF2 family [Helianthu